MYKSKIHQVPSDFDLVEWIWILSISRDMKGVHMTAII